MTVQLVFGGQRVCVYVCVQWSETIYMSAHGTFLALLSGDCELKHKEETINCPDIISLYNLNLT